MADVSMTFLNLSATTFQRGYWGTNWETGGFQLLGKLNTSPDTTLMAQSGSQSMSASLETSGVMSTPYDIYCTWYNSANGFRFGVLIHVPIQVVLIGTAPYYEISSDNEAASTTAPAWSQPGGPAQPYDWPVSVGFNINLVSTSGDTTLSLSITITDLNS